MISISASVAESACVTAEKAVCVFLTTEPLSAEDAADKIARVFFDNDPLIAATEAERFITIISIAVTVAESACCTADKVAAVFLIIEPFNAAITATTEAKVFFASVPEKEFETAETTALVNFANTPSKAAAAAVNKTNPCLMTEPFNGAVIADSATLKVVKF